MNPLLRAVALGLTLALVPTPAQGQDGSAPPLSAPGCGDSGAWEGRFALGGGYHRLGGLDYGAAEAVVGAGINTCLWGVRVLPYFSPHVLVGRLGHLTMHQLVFGFGVEFVFSRVRLGIEPFFGWQIIERVSTDAPLVQGNGGLRLGVGIDLGVIEQFTPFVSVQGQYVFGPDKPGGEMSQLGITGLLGARFH